MSLKILNLDQFQGLFKDQVSYEQFISKLKQEGTTILAVNQEVISIATPANLAREAFTNRIVSRLKQQSNRDKED